MASNLKSHATGLCGVIVLDKPRGISSMTAVEIVRKRAGGVKTGHAGTLDPLATGVLVMALGPATRFIERLVATDKRYEAQVDLSAFTETDDLQGARTDVAVDSPPSEGAIREALQQFQGRILQRPPSYSAIKIGGQRAYKLARKGHDVAIDARTVVVRSIDLVGYQWPVVELRIHCGKGFYVRSLARDLGIALGAGGHCTAIRRTAVGPFTLEMARSIETMPQVLQDSDLMSIESALALLTA